MSKRMRGLLERLLARRRNTAGDGVTDIELLRRFTHEHDEAAFELLVWRHGSMVLGLCQRAIRDEQLAEDAFQAVFLVLARKASAIRGNLGGWLFRVSRRVANRALKQKILVQSVIEIAIESTAHPTEHNELTALLDAEIARLPERLRRPVILCYLGGQSAEVAARELGCPRGTVLSRLATARKRLAERLTRRGVTLPATLTLAGVPAVLVSNTVATARSFQTGSFVPTIVTQLATGVLQTMNRTMLLTVMGGLVLAATLATGIGWGVAQQKRDSETSQRPSILASDTPTNPLGPASKASTNPIQTRREIDEKIKKLELFAETLKANIDVVNRQINDLMKVTGATSDKTQQTRRIHKHFDEVDEEYRRAVRELDKLEAEHSVLKNQRDDKDAFPLINPILVRELANQNLVLTKALKDLDLARIQLDTATKSSVDAENPRIRALKEAVAVAERKVEDATKQAMSEATKTFQENEIQTMRQRITKLRIEILIKQEICNKLKLERDSVSRLLEMHSAQGGVDLGTLRASLEPQREFLARVQRELLRLRAEQNGITLPQMNESETKFDLILRELVTLRKEVQELKEQKK